MNSHGCSMRKMKMESKGRRDAYHFMAQPNNIKRRGKWSLLMTDTKSQTYRI